MSEQERVHTPTAGEEDPFDRFNKSVGMGKVRDPYAPLAALRNDSPVHKIDLRQLMGVRPKLAGKLGPVIYTAVSHEAVSEVLRDGRRFSSKCYADSMGPVMGHSILEMDEPEHSTYRRLIQQGFTKKALERWEVDLIRPVVNHFIDRFADRGRADLVRELTFPFPVRVIAGMLGLPAEDLPQFHRWAVELISVGIDPEGGMRASRNLRDYFAGILAQRRAEAEDDLISVLAQAQVEGTKLTDEEIYAFLRLLLPAGAETTYRSSSNLLYGLLTHPDQLDALHRDRSLMERAIEEGLRWEPPLLTIMRIATEDTEVCGVKIPAGSTVSVNLGGANHDDSRYAGPDDFDIFREPRQHMAFGFGAHRCLGLHLARVETRVVIEAVLDRLVNVRLGPTAEDTYISGMIFRAPMALPVLFDPA